MKRRTFLAGAALAPLAPRDVVPESGFDATRFFNPGSGRGATYSSMWPPPPRFYGLGIGYLLAQQAVDAERLANLTGFVLRSKPRPPERS